MIQIFVLSLLLSTTLGQYCHSFESSSVSQYAFDLNSGNYSDQQIDTPSFVLRYNFCQNVSRLCQVKSAAVEGQPILVLDYAGWASITLKNSTEQLCVPFNTTPAFRLVDPENVNSGVLLTSQMMLPETGMTYTLNLQFTCGSSSPIKPQKENTYIALGSGSGCPRIDLSTIWTYFQQNKLAFFLTTLILGCLQMVFGIHLYRITLLLLGLIAAFFLLVIIQSKTVFQPGIPNAIINSVLLITFLTSVFVGYVALYFPKVGLFVMGFWVGAILAFILNNIALYRIQSSTTALPLYIAIAVLGTSMGTISLFAKKRFVTVATSFIGSYAALRALSWYLGAFPNQFLFSKEVQLGQSGGVVWQYYLYVIALFILTMSCTALQFWLFKQKTKLLGQKADIDQYINSIEGQLDQERSKYLKLQNLIGNAKALKGDKSEKSVKVKYLRRQAPSEGSEQEGDSDPQSHSNYQQQSDQQEPQRYQPPPQRSKNSKKSMPRETQLEVRSAKTKKSAVQKNTSNYKIPPAKYVSQSKLRRQNQSDQD